MIPSLAELFTKTKLVCNVTFVLDGQSPNPIYGISIAKPNSLLLPARTLPWLLCSSWPNSQSHQPLDVPSARWRRNQKPGRPGSRPVTACASEGGYPAFAGRATR